MAETRDLGPLPNYERPPVIETVLGVQFDRLPRFKNAHLGGFWKTLSQEEWPTVTDAPALPTQVERFDAGAQWAAGLRLQLTGDPSCRLRISNDKGDRMIQLQNNRLHFNWLGQGRQDYPRYPKVRKGFVSVLDRFTRFIIDEDLGEFRPDQWEVTYVNQIPQGTVWTTPADWGFFRPLAGVPTVEGVIEGESFSGQWHFVIPGQRGRLHIAWEHGKGQREGKDESPPEFVRLTLTARGAITGKADGTRPILDGLNLGHETIVRSFGTLMSNDANAYWGLKHG